MIKLWTCALLVAISVTCILGTELSASMTKLGPLELSDTTSTRKKHVLNHLRSYKISVPPSLTKLITEAKKYYQTKLKKTLVRLKSKGAKTTAKTLFARLKVTSLLKLSVKQIIYEVVRVILEINSIKANKKWKLQLTKLLRNLKQKKVLPPKITMLLSEVTQCFPTKQLRKCTKQDKTLRSVDGTCNNWNHPLSGAANTAFRRILYPRYDDWFDSPVGSSGFPKLPSARTVARVISAKKILDDKRVTDMLKTFGQFLDHDITLAPHVSRSECLNCQVNNGKCFSIPVSSKDRFKPSKCIPMGRSSAACGSGISSLFYFYLNPREQVNKITAFIDGSNIYGSSNEELNELRVPNSYHGLLRMTPFQVCQSCKECKKCKTCQACLKCKKKCKRKQSLLPFSDTLSSTCNVKDGSCIPFFLAGDDRVNENAQLISMHTIWARWHNYIAVRLRWLNKHWTGEQVFQAARKIVGAVLQKIVYKDYLPIIIGKKMPKYKGYKSKVDPSIFNSFATSAFRFGHTQLRDNVPLLDKNFNSIKNFRLPETFAAPELLYRYKGTDAFVRGLLLAGKRIFPKKDAVTAAVTEELFLKQLKPAAADDLASLNIQRGREHGLPSYTKFYWLCTKKKILSFAHLPFFTLIKLRLKKIYKRVSNIDLWAGSVFEKPLKDLQVGPTNACLLRRQFTRLRDGDRFFYKRVFTSNQVKAIEKVKLSRVICDTADDIKKVPRNAFRLVNPSSFERCSTIPHLELWHWKDTKKGK